LPLSQDGVKIVSDCPNHTVLEGGLFLGAREDKNYFQQLGIFYGCDKFPSTLVQLKPGEWVTIVVTVPTDHLPNQIRAQISFVHKRYRPASEGQTAEDLEYGTFEFSPWVQIPKGEVKGSKSRDTIPIHR